jgi:beta-galactosidase
LFEIDGDGVDYLKCGAFKGAYSTVDFGTGTNIKEAFEAQRAYSPEGPLV